ncbi:peptidyl-prolyl cis-trans isomerase FKBP53-like [Euphorbia lathyris]|uniref:peptidyl-prolyl cis-trans isomerase FKBP53-like n=1 Tax=Euphorbia lathyris TaxID=212925 RepID=UPI003313C9C3
MGFWGIEVKPGKPHPYHSDNVEGRLYVTQATLGLGSSSERCILQCSVGHKNPIYLCSLLPDRTESCSLNLEFKDELVAFSVIGLRSIHLSGYFVSDEGDDLPDEYESDSAKDISTDTEDSSEFDYVEPFTDDDDDLEMFSPSPVPKSGVVIEEIVDDEKPTHENDQSKRSKKNTQPSVHEDQNNSQQKIVSKRGTGGSVLESEDEDGFPIASSQKSKAAAEESKAEEDVEKDNRTNQTKKRQGAESDDATGKKRKVKSTDEEGQLIKKKKERLKEKSNNKVKTDGLIGDDNDNNLSNHGIQREEVKGAESQNEQKQRGLVTDAKNEPDESTSDKKKKKKKKNKKNKDNGEDTSKDKNVSTVAAEDKSVSSEDKPSAAKSSQVRTFSNGLVIEEIAMGKPDGKKASPGSQVSVRYIGKLKKNGNIFDSNVGRAPFKFRLGVGQVIKGWDVGVNGMRIGDKRRLTIPPAMGYGDRGAGGKIPPNAWLVFDVELVNVK